MQEAAASYAVYASDKRRPVELWAVQRDDLVRWLSNRLNRPIAPPDLSVAGYQLLGGRLVATGHGPAALFIYAQSPYPLALFAADDGRRYPANRVSGYRRPRWMRLDRQRSCSIVVAAEY